jgi:DNA-binding LacI/PurR family transcriptional regulator
LSSEEPALRPRLDDVAAQAGVSSATASLVLRGNPGPSAATRQRVLDAAARLGYRPDRAASVLASRRSRLLGVMLDISNAHHAQLVEGVDDAAERRGYDLVLSTVTRSRDETHAVDTLLDSRCEALVLFGPEAPAERLRALARQLPVVVIGRPVPSDGVDVVRAADDDGVAEATEYLIRLGHHRIAYVEGGPGIVAALRRGGYERAMRQHQLGGQIQILQGGHTESSGAAAARTVVGVAPRPTAVLAFNDRSAIGFIDTLVRAGIDVPEAVSVVGYDDSPIARLGHVDLTTVSQNTEELAEHAVQAIIERLDEGRTHGREVVVRPRLVIRGTAGPISN